MSQPIQPIQPIRDTKLLKALSRGSSRQKRHSSHHLENLSDPYQWASFLLLLLFPLVLVSFSFFLKRGGRVRGGRIKMTESLVKSAADFGSSVVYKNG